MHYCACSSKRVLLLTKPSLSFWLHAPACLPAALQWGPCGDRPGAPAHKYNHSGGPRSGRACHVYHGHRVLRIARGRGAAPSGAAGKGHGGHPAVVRGGGGGLGIPMASPRICTARPALRPAFVTKVELMSILAAQPPAPPPLAPRGCPAARGCGSGRNGRAITELAGWHDIDIAHVV